MPKILAIAGSPRPKANSLLILRELLGAAREAGGEIEELSVGELDIQPCRGCLRCNVLRRCSNGSDHWPELSLKILDSDVLIFASPVYFHHLPGPLKQILDRFRSFIHVRITEDDLVHTPWHQWRKRMVLIQTLGSPLEDDAQPASDLMGGISEMLGPENSLDTITATRLAMPGQVLMARDQLSELYFKLGLPEHLVDPDLARNRSLLTRARELGRELASESHWNIKQPFDGGSR
jgi:NAD(P)H-dependent FMN reductase